MGTPPFVADLLAELLEPEPGMSVYDPACGDGRLLFALNDHVTRRFGTERGRAHDWLELCGQEINRGSYRLMRMSATRRGLTVRSALGDTMRQPAFTAAGGRDLKRFDRVVGNPMWNQQLPADVYHGDRFERFSFGTPPESNADWGWLQHMHASLNDAGRMAVILDVEATQRGAPDSPETNIRREFVERGLVEAILTCEGPFETPRRLRGALPRMVLPRGAVLVISKQPRWAEGVHFIDATAIVDSYAKGESSAQLCTDRLLDICRNRTSVASTSRVVSTSEIVERGCSLHPRHWIDHQRSAHAVARETTAVRPLRSAPAAA